MIKTCYKPFEGRVEDMKSLTQPDQCQTLEEIISRVYAGLEVQQYQAYYDECPDDDFDDDPTRIPEFDFADAHRLAEETSANLKRMSDEQEKQRGTREEISKELAEDSSANSDSVES